MLSAADLSGVAKCAAAAASAADLSPMNSGAVKVQGKKVKCIYGYKATMNDELNIKIDDVIVLTQCSEDDTWLEGTLNGVTGWFPSNYVQFVDEQHGEENDISSYVRHQQTNEHLRTSYEDNQNRINEALRIKYIHELKKSEETFLDEMCKFVKVALLPLQNTNEIFPITFVHQLNASVDELIRCHQTFYQQLKEIPDNSDAKIGHLLMNLAGQFKSVYESYARNNPKFTNIINKKRDQLNKHFESSLHKMLTSLLLQSPTNSHHAAPTATTVSIYMTKCLTAPFRHIEIYVKLLNEIYRFTEDYHVDRGDVQRCVEFYTTLLVVVHETRKKKEAEMDILASRINNLDAASEAYLKGSNGGMMGATSGGGGGGGGEVLFISTVLVVTSPSNSGNGEIEIRDRIMLLLPIGIVFLKQNTAASSTEFDYDFKINLANTSQISQIRKVTDLDAANVHYGGGLLSHSSLLSSYLFELIGFHAVGGSGSSNVTSCTRFLIAFPTQYDMRQSFELITIVMAKNRSQQQSKMQAHAPAAAQSGGLVRQGSSGSNPKPHNLDLTPHRDCKSPTNLNNSKHQNSSSATVPPSTTVTTSKKMFSLRPHPPLIPHFQLPNDWPQATSLDGSLTLKRFMYKKPKLSEPFGKYHGADDDLKMLNVIESLCKTRVRQSAVNINANAAESNANKTSTTTAAAAVKPSVLNSNGGEIAASSYANGSEKSLSKIVTRLSEEKSRLEESIQSVSNELAEYKKSNKELKSIISSMQKQLENEKQMRRKLETFVRKHLRVQTGGGSSGSASGSVGICENSPSGSDLINSILMNIEHESSI